MYINMYIRELFYIMLFVIACLVIGCSHKGLNNEAKPYEFIHSVEDISSVHIVKIEGLISEENDASVSLCEIEDVDAFVSKFNKIEYEIYGPFSRPSIYENSHAIKIVYENNDKEYIGYFGELYFISGKESVGLYVCIKDEFYSLLSEYYPIELE